MESDNHFEYLVIGAGSGGVASARWAASKLGVKAAVIEKGRLGGTCVNVGCVPKKVMFNCSAILEDAHLAHTYGFSGGDQLKLDFNTLKTRRDNYVKFLNGIYQTLCDNSKVRIIEGWAKFVDNKTIEVNGQDRYTADHILIATGSHPNKIGIEGEEFASSSDDFFDLEELPKRAIVVGGGYIAVELGQIMHSLGSNVTQIVRSDILTFIDDDCRDTLFKSMELSNYDIRKGVNITKIEKVGEKNYTVHLTNGTVEENVDFVLIAAGRPPSTVDLGLENTDIKLGDKQEIVVDEYENTTVDGVYAIGDVTGKWELTPVAIRAGRTLAERLFNNRAGLKVDYTDIPTVIFSHPPVGIIGLTEKAAKEKYGEENIGVYKSNYVNMFYSLIQDSSKKPRDIIKYIVNKKDDERVVGLHLCGRNVDEMLQGASIAIKMGATKKDFDRCIAIHPTGSEEMVLTDPYIN